MKTASELRAQTRRTFKGHWGRAVVMCSLPMICLALINYLIGILTGNEAINVANVTKNTEVGFSRGFFTDNLLTMIVSLLFVVIFAGVTFKLIDWIKEPELEFSAPQSILNIFNYDFWKVVKICLWQYLFTFLWTLLFIIPGIIKQYSYSQAFNLYKIAKENGTDDQYTALDYITQSRKLMDSHKGSLFYLQLTFIGWVLLSIVTLGIGFLWVIPYAKGSEAAFFNNLIENNKTK